MHRQLKAALECCLNGTNLINELSMVMLGIRTAWREDINCSPAQLVYGTDLHLPVEFFEAQRTSTLPPGFLRELQENMRNIQPTPMAYHGKQPTHRPPSLGQTGWVYVRGDGLRGALQRPYKGPFQIVEMGDKYFQLMVNGKEEKVSVDRLKTAFRTDSTFSLGGAL